MIFKKTFLWRETAEELKEAVDFGEKNNLSVFILGGGSNLLFPDAGWDGLVIKISFKEVEYPEPPYEIGKKYLVKIGSGVLVAPFSQNLSQRGLRGLEWAGGLPGTIGGAIRGNAGAFRFEMASNVKFVWLYHQGAIKKITREECVFGYRTSLFKSILSDAVILSVELELIGGDIEESQKELDGYLKHRNESQPSYPSAGCVFKNFVFTNEKQVGDHLKKIMT
ncbi:MAG: FAD-binding protein, partial [Candidatus Magasanikbacteria bacterium]|nr:FAD-binding protein [Candidatus Magasanikbacteria bacterium]